MNASSAFHFQPNHFTTSGSSSSDDSHQNQHHHKDTFSLPSPPPSSNSVESGSTITAVTTSSLTSHSVDPFAAALGQASAVPCTPAVNTDQFSGYFPPSSSSVVDSASFASAFAFPVPTPAAVEISSFAASSPSYFPSTSEPNSPQTSHSHPQFQANSFAFNLPPPTPYPGMPPVTHFKPSSGHPWEPYPPSSKTDRHGPSSSIAPKLNLSMSVPLASLMSPPHSMPAWPQRSAGATSPPQSLPATSAMADLGIQSVNGDTVSKLLGKVLVAHGESDKNAVLLLDMRSSASHTASSIKTSVSICVPNMLLKRSMFSLTSVMEQLTTEEEADTFSRWQLYTNIVLFDAAGAIPTVGSPTILMAQKFRKEGCSATIAYLNGGYNTFAAEHSTLCNSVESAAMDVTPTEATNTGASALNARPMSTISPARHRLHLGSLPSMMTQPAGGPMGCQTPMIENPNVNPLFESVRQSIGLNTNITEEIPVRLPVGFSVDLIRDRLPNWLTSALAETTGKVRLAEYFQKIEISEKGRLALLMLPQAMRSGRTTIFSIGAGIEKGLKNRYHNIWPYDHTRVKIAEREEGHDDYINASFLKPPLSNKSYIATQGPLPSTFQDFWKVAWEQNSRVIVMLTREQEMGRIKCHQYWPTAQNPVMDLGVVHVTLVSETMPDPSIGTILVRQVKLRHLHGQEERLITQIQYTGWPDFGVPETPLEVLKVIQLSNEHNTPSSAGPMIVHCSAGCGRTGAFCVIDSILTELKDNPSLIMNKPRLNLTLPGRTSDVPSRSLPNERVANAMAGSNTSTNSNSPTAKPEDPMSDIVYAAVSTFREHRMSMVQTLRQYVFCYEAIFWQLAMEFAKDQPGLMVLPPPSLAVHTPILTMPPPSTPASNPNLSRGNAPITTTNEEFSFFG
ncbi:hypothetical protein BG006_005604 [Podila minutissima]|uniref:protein-tyrosine-phosphatase n=1 Tax=Podila minutissima TaxID=64525 RepID=A0A9P5SJM4_9FUNG|nr:hypothetical protein BG006_005604 [Podila minutissima]